MLCPITEDSAIDPLALRCFRLRRWRKKRSPYI